MGYVPISTAKISLNKRARSANRATRHRQQIFQGLTARLLVRRACFREAAVQSPDVKSGWTPMGIGSGGRFVRLRSITFPHPPLVCLCSFGRLFCRRSTSRVLSPYADSRAHASASVNRNNARKSMILIEVKNKELTRRIIFMAILFKNVAKPVFV